MYNSTEIEIGFGVSPVVFKLAKLNRTIKYIGIEIDENCFRFNNDLVDNYNVELINTDIREYIFQIPASTISKIHIYFPTPFPIERRFIDEKFVKELNRILENDGRVKIVTDEVNYFKSIEKEFNNGNWVFTFWTDLSFVKNNLLLVETKWEKTNKSKFYLECKKI